MAEPEVLAILSVTVLIISLGIVYGKQSMANSVEFAQAASVEQSHPGLHCLCENFFRLCKLKVDLKFQ